MSSLNKTRKSRRRLVSPMVLVSVAVWFASCDPGTPPTNSLRSSLRHEADAVSAIKVVAIDHLDGVTSDSVKAMERTASVDEDLLRVLAESDDRDDLAAAFLLKRAIGKGLLPELATPQVRTGAAGSGLLKALSSVPGIGEMLDLNEVVRGQIRSTIGEKLASGTPGGTKIGDRTDLTFDGFVPVTDAMRKPVQDLGAKGLVIDLGQQAMLWSLVFTRGGMWTGGTPIDGVDHGLQADVLAKTAMEWAYLFGLGQEGQSVIFGGLMVDPRSPRMIKGPYLVDGTDYAQMMASRYRVEYPEGNVLAYSTARLENWSVESNQIDLEAQALLWRATGQAFGRMRVDRRGSVAGLFNKVGEDSALLPYNTHELALVGLSQIDVSVNGAGVGFWSKADRVFSEDHNQCPGASHQLASLRALSTLVDAFVTWTDAVSDPVGAGLSDGVYPKVANAPTQLRRGVQIGVQALLSNSLVEVSGDKTSVLTQTGGTFNDADFADGLHALFVARGSLGESPYLDSLLRLLAKGFVQTVFLPAVERKSVDEDMVLWMRLVAKDIKKFGGWPDTPWADRFVELALTM